MQKHAPLLLHASYGLGFAAVIRFERDSFYLYSIPLYVDVRISPAGQLAPLALCVEPVSDRLYVLVFIDEKRKELQRGTVIAVLMFFDECRSRAIHGAPDDFL